MRGLGLRGNRKWWAAGLAAAVVGASLVAPPAIGAPAGSAPPGSAPPGSAPPGHAPPGSDEPITDPILEDPEPAELGLVLSEHAQLPETDTTPPTDDPRLLRHNRINYIGDVPDGSGRQYVPDLNGPMYLLDDGRHHEYLDLREHDEYFFSGRGMGSGAGFITFHPEFSDNGKFYTVHSVGEEGIAAHERRTRTSRIRWCRASSRSGRPTTRRRTRSPVRTAKSSATASAPTRTRCSRSTSTPRRNRATRTTACCTWPSVTAESRWTAIFRWT
ncbi:hypothetical protein [Saccharomonospora sp. CUA-673]|uniref:hypothetical protein n=1 Tax=Saccharomonospora sp. CUA-673 TaxID=1904969 RepID=UPI0021013EFD|nr:hypothetical protein [Saccharomonospora sp. CUA-673]